MDKDATNNSLAEFQSLVDLLRNKNYRGTAVKQGSKNGSPRTSSTISSSSSRSLPKRIEVPTPKFETQIQELKLQLEKRDAALAERDSIYQQQAAVIEAIVHRMSELEDKRYSSARSSSSSSNSQGAKTTTTTKQRSYEDVLQLQEEKKQLAKRKEYLERQLAAAQGEVEAMKSIIKDIHSNGKKNNEKKPKATTSKSDIDILDMLQRSMSRSPAKEYNGTLRHVCSEQNVRTKRIPSTHSRLSNLNTLKPQRNWENLEREMEATDEDSQFHFDESSQIAAMKQHIFRVEAKQRDAERIGSTEKKQLESNKRLAEGREALALQKAIESADLVSSLFSENMKSRNSNHKAALGKSKFEAPANRLKRYLGDCASDDEEYNDDEPIADLFPFCTVMYADVAGFSAWSSTRDPAQGFVLLQTLYQAFNAIAKRRKVFNVETIGDSYVAVTGFPEPQTNHAVIMAKFARDIVAEMKELMSELESSLGPDTADLAIRIGLHSGPVTAGILKGDRARFQLFGDTINIANRMESTGIKNKIQISKETYDLLVEAGKAHWARPRSDGDNALGKGTLKTYWLQVYSEPEVDPPTTAVPARKVQEGENTATTRNVVLNLEKQERLIDWMADLMGEQIMKLISQRGLGESAFEPSLADKEGTLSLDEVAEVIRLPRLRSRSMDRDFPPVSALDSKVQSQLRKYVAMIAATYHQNPFHNFEHACHVTMAVSKFIKRIMNTTAEEANSHSTLYYYTSGIHSDPLTVLAILLSALIHDADHRGVSNMQLGIEEPEMASLYKNKSIAEQNSINIAWKLLMSNQFSALQRVLFTTRTELQRFRQVLVNVVLATDIFDKEINDSRKMRWNKAFSKSSAHVDDDDDAEINSLRTTIVIEHIIQAADVSHTMQHWHIYRKWNRRLFHEMYAAFKEGRMGKDPTEFWYQGELGFFDNYIIPLAKKLKDCNVFGVSSDVCLNYAVRNRAEWEVHGQEILAEMVQELQSLY